MKGKYDDICTYAREQSNGDFVLVAILGGNKGTGFNVQTIDKDMLAVVPKMLRTMADKFEDQERIKAGEGQETP